MILYDAQNEEAMRDRNRAERERILLKMQTAMDNGEPVRSPKMNTKGGYNCGKNTKQ